MWELPILGAVAAASVYLGMPLARTGRISPAHRTALTGGTVGILAYIVLDLGLALSDQPSGNLTSLASKSSPVLLLSTGVATGLLLVLGGQWYVSGRRKERAGSGSPAEEGRNRPTSVAAHHGAFGLSAVTALAIGAHNLAEGFALGTAYASGVATVTVLLGSAIILHKATEGYCICGCDPARARRLSTTQLGLLGLLGGGPTFAGTVVGGYLGTTFAVSDFLYGLAIGAIVSVIGLILHSIPRPRGLPRLTLYGLAGFAIATGLGQFLSLMGI